MGIFERLHRARAIARLRKKVRRSPSPAAYGELAERYVSLTQLDDALRVAEQGLQRFPNSERLAQVRFFTKKKRLSGQIRKLQGDLQRRPNPTAYARLAEIYRELGDDDEALQVADECAERFPLNESPFLVRGEIRLERFLSDHIARDAVLAHESLGKVLRLNSRNAKAHLLTAELMYLVGDLEECRQHLKSVLSITPASRDTSSFLKTIEGGNDADDGALTFEDRAARVEEQARFPYAADRFPSYHPHMTGREVGRWRKLDSESLRQQMNDFAKLATVRNTILLDRQGEILADYSRTGGLSSSQFADLVSSVSETADEASRRMDTGSLVRAEVEGPAGNVTVARVQNVVLGLLYDNPLRPDGAWEMLQDFIARNLEHSPEGARA